MLTDCASLLCDLDGTLVDSLAALREVHRSFLDDRGATPAAGEFDRYNGVPLREVITALKSAHTLEGEIVDLLKAYESLVDIAYLDVAPAPGAEALLRWSAERDWRIAVVTSGRRDRASAWLTRHHLAPYVDALVGAEDVTRGKPHPAPFLNALATLEGDPAAAWAVEDSLAGVESALAAGVGRVMTVGAGARVSAGVTHCRDLHGVRALLTAEAGD